MFAPIGNGVGILLTDRWADLLNRLHAFLNVRQDLRDSVKRKGFLIASDDSMKVLFFSLPVSG